MKRLSMIYHCTNSRSSKGQALVILLVYTVVAVTILSASIIISVANAQSVVQEQEGNISLDIAESGAENALLSLLRNENYSGETLTVNGGNATVTVSAGSTKTIRSVGTISGFSRTVEVIATMSAGMLTVVSWQEQ